MMARYEVRSVDVWGNAVDGFEVNNSFLVGEVSVRPVEQIGVREGGGDRDLVQALVRAGFLGTNAMNQLEEGNLELEDNYDGLTEISEPEVAWAAVSESGEQRYLDLNEGANYDDAAELCDEDETPEEVTSNRPLLQLYRMEGDPKAVTFFKQKIIVGTRMANQPDHHAELELRINPADMKTREEREGFTKLVRTGKVFLQVEVYIDGDFCGVFDFPEAFEREDELGIAANGAFVSGDPEVGAQAKVALDAFLERGGSPATEFIEGAREAKRLGEEIRANVNAYHDGKKTYEAFHVKQLEIWREAEKLGVSDGVKDWLREHPDVTFDAPLTSPLRGPAIGEDHVDLFKEGEECLNDDCRGIIDDESAYRGHDYDCELQQWPRRGTSEEVDYALESRRLPQKSCGLNADWSVRAWHLSSGRPNMKSGDYYLLDTEEQRHVGKEPPVGGTIYDRWNESYADEFVIVRRFEPGDPEYQGDGVNSDVRDITPPDTLDALLDTFLATAEGRALVRR